MSTVDLYFLLDDTTRIVHPVSPNGSCDCGEVEGLPFYSIISDPSLREIFRMLLQSVRDTGRDLRLTLRCDKPDLRRDAYVRIRKIQIGSASFLEVENGTLSATPRKAVSLLNPPAEPVEPFVRICSWCKRVDCGNDAWNEIEEAVQILGLFDKPRLPTLTHVLCPSCSRTLLDTIAARKASRPNPCRQPE